jgi:hypothetical protein
MKEIIYQIKQSEYDILRRNVEGIRDIVIENKSRQQKDINDRLTPALGVLMRIKKRPA